jgi:Ca2+/Na+ antiporter
MRVEVMASNLILLCIIILFAAFIPCYEIISFIYLFIYLFYKPYLLFCIQQLQSDVEFDSFKIAAYKQTLNNNNNNNNNLAFCPKQVGVG